MEEAAKKRALEKRVDYYQSRYEAARMDNEALRLRLESVELDYLNSSSWKLTKPVRQLSARLRPAPAAETQPMERVLQPAPVKRDPELQKLIDAHGTVPSWPPATVIIAAWDHTEGLQETLASALGQTYPATEVLLCLREGLKVSEKTDSRVKVLTCSGANEYAAYQAGIEAATGWTVLFLPCGAQAAPDRVETALKLLESEKADVVFSGKNDPVFSTAACRIGLLRRVGGLKASLEADAPAELWLRLQHCGGVFHRTEHEANLVNVPETVPTGKALTEEAAILPVHRPKIAYVIPGCTISGGIAVVCHHANRLKRRGYEVLLLSESGEREISWFLHQQVTILPFEDAPDDIDIIVATSWSTAFTALHYPRGRKCYFVQSNEIRFFPPDSHSAYLARLSYRLPYVYMTEAQWIRDWLKAEYGQEAVYVPNGIDELLIHPCEAYRNDTGRVRVLLEGSISSPFKGMKDAFAAVKDLDCEVWCVSASGRPEKDWHCDRFIEKAAIHEMKYIYSSCDILLKMSRVEGFFGPPMEMMATGGTCVTGKVTGYDEYIVEGENALVVETGDVQGAHDALKRLIEDPALREKLVQGGRKTAAQWGWERSIQILEELYTRLYREADDIRTQY